MGFDRRFTLALAGWIALLLAALAGFILALMAPGLAATRIVAALLGHG